jgi:hypothetical protein
MAEGRFKTVISLNDDVRFSDKEEALKKKMMFPSCFDEKVFHI